MQLGLTTWQRITLVQVLGQQQGPVATIRKASSLLDILEFTPEEQEQIKLISEEPGTLRWTETGTIWHIEITEPDQEQFLKRAIEHHQGWHVRDKDALFDLMDQLGIEA